MAKFNEATRSGAKGPHPDAAKNIEYLLRMFKKCVFDTSVKIEQITDGPAGDWLAAVFVYPLKSGQTTSILEFHKEHYPFRVDTCDILNKLGFSGLLKRTDQPQAIQEEIQESFPRNVDQEEICK